MKKNIFLSFLFCSFGFCCSLNFVFSLHYVYLKYFENQILSDPNYFSALYGALLISVAIYFMCLPVIIIVSLVARFVKNIFAEKVLSVIFYLSYGFFFNNPSYGGYCAENYDACVGHVNWFWVFFCVSVSFFLYLLPHWLIGFLAGIPIPFKFMENIKRII